MGDIAYGVGRLTFTRDRRPRAERRRDARKLRGRLAVSTRGDGGSSHGRETRVTRDRGISLLDGSATGHFRFRSPCRTPGGAARG
jgi:hypothetical protein